MANGKYTGTFDGVKRDELFGGAEIPVSIRNIQVASDTTITRGMVLAADTPDGVYSLANDSDTAKSLVVAANDFVADSDHTVTQAYTSGKFNREKLEVSSGTSLTSLEDVLRKDNIILTSLKEVF